MPARSAPSKRISPSLASRSLTSSLPVVDLPQPLSPARPEAFAPPQGEGDVVDGVDGLLLVAAQQTCQAAADLKAAWIRPAIQAGVRLPSKVLPVHWEAAFAVVRTRANWQIARDKGVRTGVSPSPLQSGRGLGRQGFSRLLAPLPLVAKAPDPPPGLRSVSISFGAQASSQPIQRRPVSKAWIHSS